MACYVKGVSAKDVKTAAAAESGHVIDVNALYDMFSMTSEQPEATRTVVPAAAKAKIVVTPMPDFGDNSPELERFLRDEAYTVRRAGASVKIVGRWIWAQFPAKPTTEVRDGMKSRGWRWVQKEWDGKTGVWVFKGCPSHSFKPQSQDHIQSVYQTEVVEVGS